MNKAAMNHASDETSRMDKNASMHRQRLLEGMAHAVAAKGYAETTIADIVREASVSRRTFYEHFATRADCLIALYEAASFNALKVLRGAIDPVHGWEEQVDQAMSAYFDCLSQNPILMRTLFVEILGLGMEGLAARRHVNQEIVAFMLEVANAENAAGKRNGALSPEMAMAVVGGINELVLNAIEQDKADKLAELTAPAVKLIRAATRLP